MDLYFPDNVDKLIIVFNLFYPIDNKFEAKTE